MRRHAFPGAGAVAFAVLVGACTGGSRTTATIGPRGTGPGPEVRPASVEAVLPTVQCGDFFVADVSLNERGPFRMILDTGFPRTQISPATARALGVREGLYEVELGELRVRGRIPIGVTGMETLGYALGMEVDGILGYTVFEGLLVRYDFPGGAVSVRRGGLPADGPGVVPMSRGERPFLEARVAGRTRPVLLDTGFSGGLALVDFEGLDFREEPRPVGARVRVDGVFLRRAGRLARNVDFGAFTMERPLVVDAVRRNLLGQAVLRHFVVTLDRAGGRAQLVAPEGSPPVVRLPPLRGSGLVLVPRADRHTVAEVLEGSSAQRAGIRSGDEVVAIDGVPVGERGCPSPGEPDDDGEEPMRVLTIEREGARFDVPLLWGVLVR